MYLKHTLAPAFWHSISRRTNAVSPSHMPEAGEFHGCAPNFPKVKVKWDVQTKWKMAPPRYTRSHQSEDRGHLLLCKAVHDACSWGTRFCLTPRKNLPRVFPVHGRPMPHSLLSRGLAMGSFSSWLSKGPICLSKPLLLFWLGLPKSIFLSEATQGQQGQLESPRHGLGMWGPGQPAPTTSPRELWVTAGESPPFSQCLQTWWDWEKKHFKGSSWGILQIIPSLRWHNSCSQEQAKAVSLRPLK